jgi:hypothetical protein
MLIKSKTWKEFLQDPEQVLGVICLLTYSAFCGLLGYMLYAIVHCVKEVRL